VDKWSPDVGHAAVPFAAALYKRLTPPQYWFKLSMFNFENISQLLLNSRKMRLKAGPNSEAVPLKS
jgi:hypothetical protein